MAGIQIWRATLFPHFLSIHWTYRAEIWCANRCISTGRPGTSPSVVAPFVTNRYGEIFVFSMGNWLFSGFGKHDYLVMLKNIHLSYLLFHSVPEIFFNLMKFKTFDTHVIRSCCSSQPSWPLNWLFHQLNSPRNSHWNLQYWLCVQFQLFCLTMVLLCKDTCVITVPLSGVQSINYLHMYLHPLQYKKAHPILKWAGGVFHTMEHYGNEPLVCVDIQWVPDEIKMNWHFMEYYGLSVLVQQCHMHFSGRLIYAFLKTGMLFVCEVDRQTFE